ncbi:MAG: RNA polymerase sigma factor [Vicinamibacterales bacterium]
MSDTSLVRGADGASLDERDDAGLIEACLDGDAGAFDLFVVRHRRHVYQLCYRFVANPEDASDLSQEVFLRAFRALRGFRGQSSAGTWLHRIAVNVCLSRLSVKRPPTEAIDLRDHVDTRSESPAERLMRAERDQRVRDAVARLPDRQRASLILRVYHDMTHQEIAASLGTSVGAAKANVFHALRNLKRLLTREDG